MRQQDELEKNCPQTQNLDVLEYTSIFDDLGISSFLRNAAARKLWLLLIPILWIAVSNLWFSASRVEYQGELQVIPASTGMSPTQTSGLGDLLSNTGFGGLFGGSSNDSMFSVYTESWSAPWFAQDLLENQDLSRRIFHEQWSAETKSWKTSSGGLGNWARTIFGAPPHKHSTPDVEQMLAFLKENITIQHNRGEVMTLVTFDNHDRGLIGDVLKFGHKQITDHMRHIYQKRAQDNVSYLLNELQHVTVTEYRNSLINELAQQEKIRMMAYANKQFVAQSFGVYVTDSPVSPRPIMILAGSLLLSLLGYVALVITASNQGVSNRAQSVWRKFQNLAREAGKKMGLS